MPFCSKYHDADNCLIVASFNLDDTHSKNSSIRNLKLNRGKVSLRKLLNKFQKEKKRRYKCLGKGKDTAISGSIYFNKLAIIEESYFKENFEKILKKSFDM